MSLFNMIYSPIKILYDHFISIQQDPVNVTTEMLIPLYTREHGNIGIFNESAKSVIEHSIFY